jgi:hypothetical protein
MNTAMPLSLYDLTVPAFLRAFGNLSAILDKGRAFAEAEGRAPETLTEARLIADMAPLTAQVQRASDTAKGAMVRLGGLENPSFPDTEKSFAEMQGRIEKTMTFLNAVDPAVLDGKEGALVVLKVGGNAVTFTGRDYVQNFVLPNFYFHITTAYALLRQQGVPIGKRDYLGPF